jgi:hypothetical protein
MILPYLAIALLVVATIYSAIVSFRQPANLKRSWIFPGTASGSARIAAATVALALLAGLAVWLSTSARNSMHRASRFLIPEGYTGWIRVEFEVPNASPLPMENGQYILKIPPDGLLRTSSLEQYGWAPDHYYYDAAQGVRQLPESGPAELVWGRINGEKSAATGKRKYEEFFVGTAQQFRGQMKGR